MPVSTLLSMTQRACIRNLPSITDVADIPYDLLRPILKKIDNPQHLHALEVNSPHIADHDADLWRAFIARDVPKWQDKIIEPKNPRLWWKVYRKLVREEQQQKEAQEEQLRQAMSGLSKEREAQQTNFVAKVIPQPSRGRAFVDGIPNTSANAWGQIKTPTLQNASKGRDIMAAIRKQGNNAQKERGLNVKRSVGFGQPAKIMMPSARAQVKEAPKSMLMVYQKPAVALTPNTESPLRKASPAGFASGSRSQTAQERALNDAIRSQNAEREKRLLALTSPGAKASIATRPAANAGSPTSTASPPKVARPFSAAASPSSAASPPLNTVRPTAFTAAARLAVDSMEKKRSPSPMPQTARKRPAPAVSVFMPAKKRKV